MKPVRVDILAYAPTAYFHCQHCEIAFHQLGIGPQVRRVEADESLPVDLQFEYLDLSEWVRELVERHGANIAVRVIDAASIAGVWASLRHGVRSYPAVLVDGVFEGKTPDSGGFSSKTEVIDRAVAERVRAAGTSSKGGTT